MAITDLYHRGEKILVRIAVTKSDDSNLDYSDMTVVSATISDRQGNTVTYTKSGNTIVEGSETNEIEFEISESQTALLYPGLITCKITITYANSEFSDNSAIAILEDFDLFTILQ